MRFDSHTYSPERMMMFNFLTDAIDNGLTVVGNLITGDGVTQQQVAQLFADGLSVVAISSATGLAVDVVEKLLKD
jgi:hypothetical protein